MKKRQSLKCLVAALGFGLGLSGVAFAQATWKPNKPINLIVPWAAGGSTDQVSRIAAAEMEKVLGQKISQVKSSRFFIMSGHEFSASGKELIAVRTRQSFNVWILCQHQIYGTC